MGVPTKSERKENEGPVLDQYEILLQWTYKQGEEASTTAGKDAVLLNAFVSAGFEPVSYSHTYWSSKYHGWWVFKGSDLQKFRENILEAIQTYKLDQYMTIDFPLGRSQSPPFTRFLRGKTTNAETVGETTVETVDETVLEPIYKPEITLEVKTITDMQVEICDLVCGESVAEYRRAAERDPEHAFDPQIVGDTERVARIIDRGDRGVSFRIEALGEGQATLFVSVDGGNEGPAVRINVTKKEQSEASQTSVS